VHEHILAAVIRLNEAEAFLAIKPFYCTLRHMTFFHVRVSVGRTVVRPGYVRDLGRSLVRRVERGEANEKAGHRTKRKCVEIDSVGELSGRGIISTRNRTTLAGSF
jgi:hypothetical protein